MTYADIFISFISAFNFKHLQTEKNIERPLYLKVNKEKTVVSYVRGV